MEALVSVPLRGKEGAGRASTEVSPCTPRRTCLVSVPLRGKEGAGQKIARASALARAEDVSVPLRGKEGAGRA